jgi:hypothetical protein
VTTEVHGIVQESDELNVARCVDPMEDHVGAAWLSAGARQSPSFATTMSCAPVLV